MACAIVIEGKIQGLLEVVETDSATPLPLPPSLTARHSSTHPHIASYLSVLFHTCLARDPPVSSPDGLKSSPWSVMQRQLTSRENASFFAVPASWAGVRSVSVRGEGHPSPLSVMQRQFISRENASFLHEHAGVGVVSMCVNGPAPAEQDQLLRSANIRRGCVCVCVGSKCVNGQLL